MKTPGVLTAILLLGCSGAKATAPNTALPTVTISIAGSGTCAALTPTPTLLTVNQRYNFKNTTLDTYTVYKNTVQDFTLLPGQSSDDFTFGTPGTFSGYYILSPCNPNTGGSQQQGVTIIVTGP